MILEINNQPIDYEGTIAITRQSFDANNMGLRLIDITNNITIPKTENNKRVLIGANNLDSDVLDTVYECRVIDGYFLFNGIGYLKNTGTEWKLQLVDASKMFFDDLKADLKELDFEANDFTYGTTAYNTLKNLSSNVWVWPIVKMHESASETSLLYLRPHFSFWTLLNKIFTSRGKTLNVDTTILQNLAIQGNSDDFIFTSYQKTLTGTAIGDLTTNDFNFGVTVATGSVDVGLVNKTAFKIRGNISSTSGGVIKFGTDEIEIKQGDNYYDVETSQLTGVVAITLTGNATFDNTLLYTTIKESSFDTLPDLAGYRVKAYDNLPDISQRDLLFDALTFSNSIIVPDNFNKVINFVNLTKKNKKDWTSKFIHDSETITSSIERLAKKNKLTYTNGIGDSFFETDVEYLNDESKFIELRYAGAADKTNFAVYDIYEVDADLNNVRKESSGLHIVSISTIYGKFTPLTWANLKAYYSIFDAFRKPRQMTALFNLNKVDALGFNATDVIYLSQFNSNFLIQSIEGWAPNQLTQVRLLKV